MGSALRGNSLTVSWVSLGWLTASLFGTGVCQAADITLAPVSQLPALTSSAQSEKPFAAAIESFRLSNAVQVHHFIAPHAKDLWREVDDQRTVNVKSSITVVPGLLAAESELSFRDASNTPTRGLGNPADQMIRMGANGASGSFRYGLSYRSTGKDYVKEADQAVRDLWGEWRLGTTTLRAGIKESWNNVAGDAAITRLQQRQEQLTVAIPQSAWPAVNLSYTHSNLASTLDPEGIAATRGGGDTMDAALSYQAASWTARLASTYAHSWTQSPAVTVTDSMTYAITGSYRPRADLSLDPTLSLKEDRARTTGVTTETPTGGLSMKYAPGPAFTWSGAGTYGLSRSSDGLTNTRAISARQALAWKPTVLPKLPTTFSLETAFQRTTDRANADRATSDLSAFFRLQVTGF